MNTLSNSSVTKPKSTAIVLVPRHQSVNPEPLKGPDRDLGTSDPKSTQALKPANPAPKNLNPLNPT